MQVDKIQLHKKLPNGKKQVYFRWICSCGSSNKEDTFRCKKCSTDRFTFVEELALGKRITKKLLQLKRKHIS